MTELRNIVKRVILAASLAEDPYRTEVREGGLKEQGDVASINADSLGTLIEAVMAQAGPFYAAVTDLRAALARLADEKSEARAIAALYGALGALDAKELAEGSDAVNLIQGDLMRHAVFLTHLAEALNLAHSERSSKQE